MVSNKCIVLITKGNVQYESLYVVTRHVSSRYFFNDFVLFIYGCLRKNLGDIPEVRPMIYLTAVVVVFLFIYLILTLARPEWF